jgi:ATP-dependent DNA ligase
LNEGRPLSSRATISPSITATREYALAFYLFDLLILAGEDLRTETLETRRTLLRTQVMPRLAEPIRLSETIQASAAELIPAVRDQSLEGVIAKRQPRTLLGDAT